MKGTAIAIPQATGKNMFLQITEHMRTAKRLQKIDRLQVFAIDFLSCFCPYLIFALSTCSNKFFYIMKYIYEILSASRGEKRMSANSVATSKKNALEIANAIKCLEEKVWIRVWETNDLFGRKSWWQNTDLTTKINKLI